MYRRAAFTLIELLVVIAIIAVLAVVVVLTLNPAQLLAQSRDANRLSDLATLNSAIGLYNTDQSGASGFSLGLSSTTYVSLPDPTASTTCGGLGGNFTPGGYFTCATATSSRNVDGTGWIPVDFNAISAGSPIGSLPVDPVNSTSSNLYYSYQTNGTTFRLAATPESQKYLASAGTNPTMFVTGSNTGLDGGNWVIVPGNSQFGTNNFYVMKYDAVCSDGNGNYLNDYNTGYETYADNSKNCTSANGRQISSLPGGWPIANVSQTSAATYCASIGAHLITNNEWQTIAWNAENVASNWSGGAVGSGAIYVGHNDSQPNYALPADPNDANSCAGTDGPASCGGTGSNATQIRTLALSNGSIIWDMAGNVWQWTNNTITGTNEPNGGTAGWNWIQFSAVTTWGSMSQSTIGASNATWNSTQGIGELSAEDASDATIYGFLRGGSWGDGGNAGVEALNLGYTPGSTFPYIGFRCAR